MRNVAKTLRSFFERGGEYEGGKGENAGYQYFLLPLQLF